jgi:hypothetical protein
MNAMLNDAAQFQRNVTRNNEIEMKKNRNVWKCNVTMQSEPLKWNREIGNLEIVNGSKIGSIEMES